MTWSLLSRRRGRRGDGGGVVFDFVSVAVLVLGVAAWVNGDGKVVVSAALVVPSSSSSSSFFFLSPRTRVFGTRSSVPTTTTTTTKATQTATRSLRTCNRPSSRCLSSWSSSSSSSSSSLRTSCLSPRAKVSNDNDKDEHDASLPPIPADWKEQVLSTLSSVMDPDLGQDIVSLGFIKNLSLADSDADSDAESESESDANSRRRRERRRVVSFDVELTTPACPIKEQFRSECTSLVEALPWAVEGSVDVTMTSSSLPPPNDPVGASSAGLSRVGSIIAVSSCKGGVGKSTTAVNLAFSLQALGASVGIFDVDVYGPSLPTMVTPRDDAVHFVGRQIAPLERDGVKLMSFGYVNDGSAVMRGPMVTQLLDQFLSLVNWGPLDYLVLDMPPGTGDIQLTLSQRLNITAAVIVTTPQELSFADVVRGIDMFDSVNVPCVAVVENMAYYELPKPRTTSTMTLPPKMPLDTIRLGEELEAKLRDTGVVDGDFGLQVQDLAEDLVGVVERELMRSQGNTETTDKDKHETQKGIQGNGPTTDADADAAAATEKVHIFGPGHRERLSRQYGIEHTYSVPLLSAIASKGDAGDPFVLVNPHDAASLTYKELASSVVREVSKIKYSRDSIRPSFAYRGNADADAKGAVVGTIVVDGKHLLSPATLRRNCRCASCVEEFTGRQLLKASDISDLIRFIKMEPCGNYALSVDWSDGHRSLYPYRQIHSLLGGGGASSKGGEKAKEEEEKEREENRIVL